MAIISLAEREWHERCQYVHKLVLIITGPMLKVRKQRLFNTAYYRIFLCVCLTSCSNYLLRKEKVKNLLLPIIVLGKNQLKTLIWYKCERSELKYRVFLKKVFTQRNRNFKALCRRKIGNNRPNRVNSFINTI